jgi:Cytidylyltransferase-like
VTAAAYPGSFNPPTVAHLAIAEAVRAQAGVRRVDLVVSNVALGKEDVAMPTLADRLGVLRAVASGRDWLDVRTTPAQLVVDVADGYDALVVGADKWAQIIDPAWYGGDVAARNAALARLPPTFVVPRPPFPLPDAGPLIDEAPPAVELRLDAAHHPVSSSAARAGRREWMLPEAAAFDERTGAWSDPERYRRWLMAR